MKKVIFQEVGMKNFGPYIEPMILKFDDSKITMLVGPNGVGKTMALDAIPFTLYGITSKGVKGDEVVNNKKKKDCHTWVKFRIDEDQYEVNRYQKHKLGNTVILNYNGVDIKKGHKEVLPEIERILCPSKTFMNTLMFGQKVKDFFTDLTDTDKKEIFRKILSLDNYVLYYNQAKKDIDSAQGVVEELKRNMNSYETLMTHLDVSIQQDRVKKKEFEEEKVKKLKNFELEFSSSNTMLTKLQEQFESYENIDEKIVTIRNDIKDVTEKLKNIDVDLNKELNELQEKAKAKQTEMVNLATAEANTIKTESFEKLTNFRDGTVKTSLQQLDDAWKALQENKNNLFLAQTKISPLIAQLNGEINNLRNNITEGTCPTCFQVVGEETKIMVERMIFEKTQAMKLLKIEEDKLEKLAVQQDDKEKEWKVSKKTIEDDIKIKEKKIKEDEDSEVTAVLKRLSETKEKIRILLTQQTESIKEKYAQNLIEYNEKLDKLNTSQLSIAQQYKEYRALGEKINSTKTNLAVISNNRRQLAAQNYDSQEEQLTKQLTEIEGKIVETNAKLFQINRQISIFEFWKDAYSPSGIPSMLVDEAIPFMNHKMSEYLDLLTNGRYVVSFDTLSTTKAGEFRDKISVHLLDTQTQSNTRGQFSGGQTRIVDIATILTLGDLQANIQNMFVNILLFDEIFDSLDAENISNVAKVLNKIKKDKSIYIISHTHQDGIDVDEVLSINK